MSFTLAHPWKPLLCLSPANNQRARHLDVPQEDRPSVEQIEAAPKAQTGMVVVNLRNTISHDECWPLLNADEYRSGAEPIFGAYTWPEAVVTSKVWEAVAQKRNDVVPAIFWRRMNKWPRAKAFADFGLNMVMRRVTLRQ